MTVPASSVTPSQALKLDHQLCFALYSASLAMTRVYKPLLEPLGLTYPQYLVMLALWEASELSVSALGARLSLDSGTLTPLLKRLEALGLVERQRDSEDERRVLVAPSAAGKRLRARAQSIPGCLLDASGCELPEILSLTRKLQRLRANLQR